MKKTNFGILGCGTAARIHAEALQTIKEARLCGVADANFESAAAFAEKYGIKPYPSFEEMLVDETIDAVCVCTPSYLHAEHAIAALSAGKHVALEKPMALSVEEADRVTDVCEKAGKKLTVISQLRFSEDIARVKRLIREGTFGTLTLCELSMKHYRSEEYFTSSDWKGKLAFEGGGALMNQGIHGVDLLLYLCGEAEVIKGEIRTLSHKIEVEDTATALLALKGGALGVITASTCAYPGFERSLRIHGDKGFVFLNENRIERMLTRDGETIDRKLRPFGSAGDATALESDLHRKQLENFVGAIHGEEELHVGGRDGRAAIKLIKDIYGE